MGMQRESKRRHSECRWVCVGDKEVQQKVSSGNSIAVLQKESGILDKERGYVDGNDV